MHARTHHLHKKKTKRKLIDYYKLMVSKAHGQKKRPKEKGREDLGPGWKSFAVWTTNADAGMGIGSKKGFKTID